MDSAPPQGATLIDLIDRVLDRGLVINADIVISLAGVPLIGINLRAALAGMETMTKYGVMKDWDQNIRAQVSNTYEPSHTAVVRPEKSPVETASTILEY